VFACLHHRLEARVSVDRTGRLRACVELVGSPRVTMPPPSRG